MSMILVQCDYCQKQYEKRKKDVNYNNKHGYKNLCSKECLSLSRYSAITTNCFKCGKRVSKTLANAARSKSGRYYCSRSCSASANNSIHKKGSNHPNYNGGLASYRKRALEYYGSKCAFCDYSIKAVLQVHHKDRDRKNNDLTNLVVLCPTHHKEIHVGEVNKLTS